MLIARPAPKPDRERIWPSLKGKVTRLARIPIHLG